MNFGKRKRDDDIHPDDMPSRSTVATPANQEKRRVRELAAFARRLFLDYPSDRHRLGQALELLHQLTSTRGAERSQANARAESFLAGNHVTDGKGRRR